MVLELKLSKSKFILRESIKVEVVLRNTGASAADVAVVADNRNTALRYTLAGPSFEEPFAFSYGGPKVFRIPGDPAKETLGPGAELSTPITVQQYHKGWKTGKHTLRAEMGEVKSNTVEFEVLEPEVLSAEVLVDQAPSPTTFMRVLFLANAGKGGPAGIYQAFFPEVQPDVELTPEGNIMQTIPADPRARQVAGSWTSGFDRSSLLFARFGWRGENGLLGVDEFESQVTVQASGKSATVRPSYLTEAGDLIWMTLADREVSLWRVPRKEAGEPVQLWTLELPFQPSVSRFAYQAAEGGKAAGLFAAETLDGEEQVPCVEAVLVNLDGQIIDTLKASKAKMIPQSEAGLWVSAKGDVRALLLLADPEDPRKLRVAEWVRPHDTEPEKTVAAQEKPAFEVPEDPIASAAIYGPPLLSNPRRDWVVVLENGFLVTNRDPGNPRELEGQAVLPLQLLPRPQMTYLLMTHPAEVVYLAPMF